MTFYLHRKSAKVNYYIHNINVCERVVSFDVVLLFGTHTLASIIHNSEQ